MGCLLAIQLNIERDHYKDRKRSFAIITEKARFGCSCVEVRFVTGDLSPYRMDRSNTVPAIFKTNHKLNTRDNS
jgi:hypothetical protein